MPQTCPQCQSQAPDDANNCSSCGSPLAGPATGQAAPAMGGAPPAAAAPTAAPAAATSGSSIPAYKFNAARWSLADRIAGMRHHRALHLAVPSDWFTASATRVLAGRIGERTPGTATSTSSLIVCILIVAYLVSAAVGRACPSVATFPHLTVMFVATIVNLVITFIAFIFKPSVPVEHVSVAWSIRGGAGLLAAIVAAAPYAVPQLRAKTM